MPHCLVLHKFVRFTCAASASCSLGMRLSLEAFASTNVPSTDSLSPRTRPASANTRDDFHGGGALLVRWDTGPADGTLTGKRNFGKVVFDACGRT